MDIVLAVVGVALLLLSLLVLATLTVSRTSPDRALRRMTTAAAEAGADPHTAALLQDAVKEQMEKYLPQMQRLGRPMRIGTVLLSGLFAAAGAAALAGAKERSDLALIAGAVGVACVAGCVVSYRAHRRGILAFAAEHDSGRQT